MNSMNTQVDFNNLPSRRQVLGGAAGLALAAAGCRRGSKQARPNILWLIAEDLSTDLGCYGNRLARTPNIDRLASEGVRFTNAFVTAPVCSASRSALATGMYQTSIGAHHHRSHRSDGYRLMDGIDLFPHYFRQAGYHTSNVLTAAAGVKGTGKTDFNFQVDKVFDGTDWNQRREGQPFYAQVNFSETHRAFHRFTERPTDPAKVELPPYYPDDPAVRLDWALYLDSAQHLDVKVGKVLERLKEEGVEESTIVIFFGDNGRPMPRDKQFLYDGGIHVPLIVRIPERFRPEGYQPGSVRDDMVNAIDIPATSLRLAGIEPPIHMQGQVFLGSGEKGRDFIVAARDRCDETADRIRCVRTKKYKYIRNFFPERPYAQPNVYKDTSYPTLQAMRQLQKDGKLTGPPALFLAARRPPEELYDLEVDPHEIHNLVALPEHEKTLTEMKNRLDRWIRETGDQGESPEKAQPEENKYRAQADGWCGKGECLLSKTAGALRVQCSGKGNEVVRSWVAADGERTVRFRARSKDVPIRAFAWNTIEDMASSPKNRANVDFAADGQWHEHFVSFKPGGYLALLRFDLGDAGGTIEFDWIRLYANSKGEGVPAVRWEFA
jgi:arylsulfatase A-like enzyme